MYLVFVYEHFYPSGGINDLKEETSDSIEEIKSRVKEYVDCGVPTTVEIVDKQSLKIVLRGVYNSVLEDNKFKYRWNWKGE